jgi:hypothetical protein
MMNVGETSEMLETVDQLVRFFEAKENSHDEEDDRGPAGLA